MLQGSLPWLHQHDEPHGERHECKNSRGDSEGWMAEPPLHNFTDSENSTFRNT